MKILGPFTLSTLLRKWVIRILLATLLLLPSSHFFSLYASPIAQDDYPFQVETAWLNFSVAPGDISESQAFAVVDTVDFSIDWDWLILDSLDEEPAWAEIDLFTDPFMDNPESVVVTVDASALDEGNYDATLYIFERETEELLAPPVEINVVVVYPQQEETEIDAAPLDENTLLDETNTLFYSVDGTLAVNVSSLEFTVDASLAAASQAIALSNNTDAPIDWGIWAVSYDESVEGTAVDWLYLPATDGTLADFDDVANVDIYVDASGLTDGVYTAELEFFDLNSLDSLILPITLILDTGIDGADPLFDPIPFDELIFEAPILSTQDEMMVDISSLEFFAPLGETSDTHSFVLLNLSDEPIDWAIFAVDEDDEIIDELNFTIELIDEVGEVAIVNAFVDARELDEGDYFGTVIIQNVDTLDELLIPASLTVLPADHFSLGSFGGGEELPDDFFTDLFESPLFVDEPILFFEFDAQAQTPIVQSFTITTSSIAPREFFIGESDDWLSVMPESGTVTSSAGATVQVTVEPTTLPSGLHLAEIAILDTESDTFESVLVDVEIAGDVTIQVAPQSLQFEAVQGELAAISQTITITGAGVDPLEWYAYSEEEWLVLSYNEADLSKLHVSIDSALLGAGSYADIITVESNGGARSIPVSLAIRSILQASPDVALPDLDITGLRIDPPRPTAGQNVTFYATITNIGETNELSKEFDEFYVDLFFNPKVWPRGGLGWRAVPSTLTPKDGIRWEIDLFEVEDLALNESFTICSDPNKEGDPDCDFAPMAFSDMGDSTADGNASSQEWDGTLPAGVTEVVLSVDSWERSVKPNGRILESDEANNQERFPPIVTSRVGTNPEIELYGLEVTQAVQNLKNEVPLIAQKPTYVRAHVRTKNGAVVQNVTAKLIGTRNGTHFADSPLAPINEQAQIDIVSLPNRSARDDAFLFRLPESWIVSGTITLEFQMDTVRLRCAEIGEAVDNQDCKVTASFEEAPALPIQFFELEWTNQGRTYRVNADTLSLHERELLAQFPISELDLQPAQQLRITQSQLLTTLVNFLRQILDTEITQQHSANLRYIYSYGLAPNLKSGWGYIPQVDDDYGLFKGSGSAASPELTVHELGHMHGLYHTNCSGKEPDADKSSFPYTSGFISGQDDPMSAETYYGFHIYTQRIIPPDAGDIMSYCPQTWVSSHAYRHMLATLHSREQTWRNRISNASGAASGGTTIAATTSANSAQAGPASDAPDAMLIQGGVSAEGVGTISSIYLLDVGTNIPLPTSGSYTIQTRDSSDNLLNQYDFAMEETDGGEPLFSLILPYESEIRAVALLFESEEIALVAASANQPQVTLLSPTNGETVERGATQVQWSASDADGDPMSFSIDYSTDDGATWQLLHTGLTGASTSSAVYSTTIDFGTVAGSDNGWLRVRASDGFYASMGLLPGRFTVPNALPEVQIATLDGERFVNKQLIVLDGKGIDLEDGPLSGSSLIWSSTRDGRLKTGDYFEIAANLLKEGEHTITLTARDSSGATAAKHIQLTIARQPGILPGTLALYPPEVQAIVSISATSQPVTHTIRIDNVGNNDVQWQASTDTPWIEFDDSTGFAPAEIEIRINASGIAIGDHRGYVLFTDMLSSESQRLIVDLRVKQ